MNTHLQDKIRNGRLYVDQGIIAGCAGGGFENICAAADILKGNNIGSDEFTLSVYPASMPVYMELIKNGAAADYYGSRRCNVRQHSADHVSVQEIHLQTMHLVSDILQETSLTEKVLRLQNGQISSVALMDARSIAATAANKGYLTAATDMDVEYKGQNISF